MKKLSILIPHYNTPDLLKILLDSITVSDAIEVIVCDDRSTKGLDDLKALQSACPHVTFIFNQSPIKGAGASRNAAIDLASGDFVLFADSDDYFVKDWWSIIEPYLVTDQDLVVFKFDSVYLNTQQDAHRSDRYKALIDAVIEEPSQTNEDALRFMNPTPVAKLIRRRLLTDHQIRFDLIRHSEDVMFAAKVGFHASKVIADPRVLYIATRSEGSQTMTESEAIFDLRLEVLIRKFRYLKENLLPSRFKTLKFESVSMLISAAKGRYGFGKVLRTAITMKKNGMRLLPQSIWHPSVFLTHLKHYRLKHRAIPPSKP